MKTNFEELKDVKNEAIKMIMSEIGPEIFVANEATSIKGMKMLAVIGRAFDDMLDDYQQMFKYVEETKHEIDTLKRKLDNQETLIMDLMELIKKQDKKN